MMKGWDYGRHDPTLKTTTPGEEPLYMETYSNWTYTDGTPMTTTSYNLGYEQSYDLVGPCVFLKKSTRFIGKKADCTKKYGYICKWKGNNKYRT